MISLLFVCMAGICNSIMDTISFRLDRSIFPDTDFVNPKKSWKRKWKNGDPKQGERFFGSSTFLVFTTDLWHLAQSAMLTCYTFAILLYSPMFHPVIDYIILHSSFGLSFELFWSKIWKK